MPLKPGDEPFSLSKSLKATKAIHLVYFYP